ncbi:heterokaryon incompatibility protein-domain-containing protein [Xylogone sp. PMI_703]|nr:heterokaryon incompatibility protein-domain-containing protein [Xylogone sp. PMI_703]
MRLLHAQSVRVKSFDGHSIPPYAILSHTWGNDEVSFYDICNEDNHAASKSGYVKLKYACEEALKGGLRYVWVDTCCIDKTSSAEISEAINSMFRWYKDATVCYAYLSDVPEGDDASSPESAFAKSRWFSRGWTLQELLAPARINFFSSNWKPLGSKFDLRKQIPKITGIGERFVIGVDPLSKASVAKRMSWASNRKTTRIEDLAYCLLGIFDISMPMLYGEGEKAFIRLQEEIMKTSDDQTLFAWGRASSQMNSSGGYCSPFARSPADFEDCGDLVPDEFSPFLQDYSMTNRGLQINLPVIELSPYSLAVLACRPESTYLYLIGIKIVLSGERSFMRLGSEKCLHIHRDEVAHTPVQPLRFLTRIDNTRPLPGHNISPTYLIRKIPHHGTGLSIWNVEPRDSWNPKERIIQFSYSDKRNAIIRLWRKEQDGFAILLHREDTGIFTSAWVFRETRSNPISYDMLAATILTSSDKEIREYDGVQVIIGQPILTPTGIAISPIDIELLSQS